ncbi:MAG: D-mannonate epimerase, partial [Clostridia bacterium]|nr:D-mannonate epimerase [Clostridia bacterium]
MYTQSVYAKSPAGLSRVEIKQELSKLLTGLTLNKVLLLPPDYTRYHSYAGQITVMLWELLKDRCEVDIMPALGTHVPVSESEWEKMFAP